jgi:hypothetical protein
MARRAKHEYLLVMWHRYQQADRATRSDLLDDVTRVCRYHRKYAIGLLSRRQPPRPPVRRVSWRRPTYSEPVIRLLAEIWAASGYLCGPRLKAAIPHWLPWLTRRTAVTPAVEGELRRLVPGRSIAGCGSGSSGSNGGSTARRGRAPRSSTRFRSRRTTGMCRRRSIWRLIWCRTRGGSAAGEFLHTLDWVDIQTTWVGTAGPPGQKPPRGHAGDAHHRATAPLLAAGHRFR